MVTIFWITRKPMMTIMPPQMGIHSHGRLNIDAMYLGLIRVMTMPRKRGSA
jgi:hypothetical protein